MLKRFWQLCLVLLLLCPALPAFGANWEDLASNSDRYFRETMAKEQIPGAVLAIVKDDKVILLRGYGLADLEHQILASPQETFFRVGSVSKLFTTTAAMQLVEENKLDLDADVNRYLKHFQLENNFSQPVTMANLLTHTGGIDENFIGIAARRAEETLSLRDYVARHVKRSLPPGEVHRYSNQGFALAGYLVEAISGMPFARYMDEFIFQPLGMNHSTFQVGRGKNWAVGYRQVGGRLEPMPTFYTNDVPSGALNTTAADMTRFMLAYLHEGDSPILRWETQQQVKQQQFTHHPLLPGHTYGFYERWQNGVRGLEHHGQIAGYTSRIFLLPDEHIGVFMACNRNQTDLYDEFIRQFLEQYFPAKIDSSDKSTQSSISLSQLSGTYRLNRYPHRGIEKLAMLIPGSPLVSQIIRVHSRGDTLFLNDRSLSAIAPLVFQPQDGEPILIRHIPSPTIAFRQEGGKITYLFIGKTALEPLAWWQRPVFQPLWLGSCLFIFLGVTIAWIAVPGKGKIERGWRGRSLLLSRGICLLNLAFPVGLGLAIARLGLTEFIYGMPTIVTVLLGIPLIAAVLSFVLLGASLMLWFVPVRWSDRLLCNGVAIASLVYLLFLEEWNLLGFNFGVAEAIDATSSLL